MTQYLHADSLDDNPAYEVVGFGTIYEDRYLIHGDYEATFLTFTDSVSIINVVDCDWLLIEKLKGNILGAIDNFSRCDRSTVYDLKKKKFISIQELMNL